MKRDWDLIRKIMLKVEESAPHEDTAPEEVEGYDQELVAYNMRRLIERDLCVPTNRNDAEARLGVAELTWEGHDFLDKIRTDDVWVETKKTFKDKCIDLTFDLIGTVSSAILMQKLGVSQN